MTHPRRKVGTRVIAVATHNTARKRTLTPAATAPIGWFVGDGDVACYLSQCMGPRMACAVKRGRPPMGPGANRQPLQPVLQCMSRTLCRFLAQRGSPAMSAFAPLARA